MDKSRKVVSTVHEPAQSKPDGPPKIPSDHFSKFLDPSGTGVELVQLKKNQSRTQDTSAANNINGNLSRDPLLSIDTQSTRSWSSMPMNSETSDDGGIQRHLSGGEWGDMLDMISRRKTQALAPEHFENMWTKGRNYRNKEGENRLTKHVPQDSSSSKLVLENNIKATSKPRQRETLTKSNPFEGRPIQSGCTGQSKEGNLSRLAVQNLQHHSLVNSYQEDDEENIMQLEELNSGSSTSYTSEEENGCVTGLDSPGTKVWDGKSNRNMTISHIHHPLETSEGHVGKKTSKGHVRYQRVLKTQSGQKRSRPNNQKVHVWQEVERTSFLSGDGQDILSSSKGHANDGVSSDDSDVERLGRIYSGAAASSSAPSISAPDIHGLAVNSLKNSLAVDSFYKLRCEVRP